MKSEWEIRYVECYQAKIKSNGPHAVYIGLGSNCSFYRVYHNGKVVNSFLGKRKAQQWIKKQKVIQDGTT